MRIQIVILGFQGLKRVNCIISQHRFCFRLDEYCGTEWKNNIGVWQTPARIYTEVIYV